MLMTKKKALIVFLPLFFLLAVPTMIFAYPDATTKILERYTFSLGNDTCVPLECNIASIQFYIPADKGSQDVRMKIHPECFTYNFTGGQYWNLTIFCLDGTYIEYDMKSAMCNNTADLDFEVKVNSSGYSFFGERQFQQFWCAFKRNSNVNEIPVEFNVLIDGVGLYSKYTDSNTRETYDSQSQLALSLQSITTLSVDVWGISYNFFLVMAIIIGIIFGIAFVPMAIKYVFRKVLED